MSENNKIVSAGEIFIRQGEQGKTAYIIERGLVEISFTKPDGSAQVVGTRGPGSLIGEMSLIDEAPRTADVKALEECSLIQISRDEFIRRLRSSDEIMQAIMRVLMTRYRDTLTRSVMIAGEDSELPTAEETERHYLEEAGTLKGLLIEQEFKAAMSNGQLFLNYQPIINLQTGKITGFESLMRWNHPERGFVSPAEFIPMAELSGLIIEASQWGLRLSCRTVKDMNARRTIGQPPLYASVNFSTKDFAQEDFLENLERIVTEEGVRPEEIQIEITESLLMEQPERAKTALTVCRDRGFSVAIDDFGTGYSSLAYLHKYPISALKIDQSFVRDMLKNQNSFELCRSIIALGKNLKMTIVAEGIEGKEEALTLRDLGCDTAQGFYFSRPVGMDDLRNLIVSGREFSSFLK